MSQPHRARPKTADEVANMPARPEIVTAARERGVKDGVHFTTVRGAVGILAVRAVKSGKRLQTEQFLEHVSRPNAHFGKALDWLAYVNVSITRINDWMFKTSLRWHIEDNDNPWVVFAFDPKLLGDPGVVFATTNNIYPACRRAGGLEGFSSLFADNVLGRYDKQHNRMGKMSDWPTDRQAEVLYPGELSCDYLHRIDVQREEPIETIHGMLAVLGLNVQVRHAPEVFK